MKKASHISENHRTFDGYHRSINYSPAKNPCLQDGNQQSFAAAAKQILPRAMIIGATIGLGLHFWVVDLTRTANNVAEPRRTGLIVKNGQAELYWPVVKGIKRLFSFSVKAGLETSGGDPNDLKDCPPKEGSYQELYEKFAVNFLYETDPTPPEDKPTIAPRPAAAPAP